MFVLPAVGFFATFGIFPMLFGLDPSFTDYDLPNPLLWVGLDNLFQPVSDPLFRKALANTLMFVVGDSAGMGAVAAGRAAVRPGVPRPRHPEGDVLPARVRRPSWWWRSSGVFCCIPMA